MIICVGWRDGWHSFGTKFPVDSMRTNDIDFIFMQNHTITLTFLGERTFLKLSGNFTQADMLEIERISGKWFL